MNQLQIRKATIEDVVEIAGLVNGAYRPQPGYEGWTHESSLVSGERINANQVADLLSDSVILAGLHCSKIVACIQIMSEGNDAYIGMLAVEPDRQTFGLGTMMLMEAETYAKSSLGATEFMLVVIRARNELVEFYRRRGYQETGKRLAYPMNSGFGEPRNAELDLIVLRKSSETTSMTPRR